MRIVLVTSQVHYTPANNVDAWRPLFERHGDKLVAVVVVQTPTTLLLKSLAKALAAGFVQTSTRLTSNALACRRRHELVERSQATAVPVHATRTVNSSPTRRFLRDVAPDLIINQRTTCFYGRRVLRIPHIACINVHHGLLPYQRGRFCDFRALAENRPTGFSIHQMTDVLDDGAILHVEQVSDGVEKSYQAYLDRAARREGDVLAKLVDNIAETGKLPPLQPNVDVDVEHHFTPTLGRALRLRAQAWPMAV